ncbi:MAG: rRNA cytosine-C5-methyltransferase [Thermoflavifilum aggregans]|nr:rRNA cytosine-C5-methyltransferase [Thermoflavifilum aggregans]
MNSLPEDFLKSLSSLPGAQPQALLEAHTQKPPVSLRLHAAKWQKWTGKEAEDAAKPWLPVSESVPWAEHAFYLKEKPAFIFDPLFYAGAYYVQEASSMFVDFVVRQWAERRTSSPALLLDLCAAPGGKSTILLSHMQPHDLLISNETVPARWQVLQENLIRWGCPQIILTQLEARHFQAMPQDFDVILVDAPCSGSGMFRKDRRMPALWKRNSVLSCSRKQQHLLQDIWPVLKPGGWLIYSTCSFSPEENEQVIDRLMAETGADPVLLPIPESWHIVITHSPQHQAPGYRFYPDRLQGEGFYLAVLQKPLHHPSRKPTAAETPRHAFIWEKTTADAALAYLEPSADLSCFRHADTWFAFPSAQLSLLQHISQRMPIRQAGLCLGQMKHDWVPDHALALSLALRKELPAVALSREQALHYLQKQPLSLPELTPGWYVVTYAQFPLGWIKSIGHRINNYYPKSWKIHRSLPDMDMPSA